MKKHFKLILILFLLATFTAIVNTRSKPHPLKNIQSLTGTTVSGTEYFVSPDGGVSTTSPTGPQCAANQGQNTDRTKHFTTIQAGISCLAASGDLVINAMNAAGTIVAYNESGFGMGGSMPSVPSGTSAANATRIVGRCNTDIAGGSLVFTRTSCKPLIQPSASVWGTVGSTNRQFVFYFPSQSYIKLDNLEFSGSNIGRNGAGDWDGTVCNCYKGFIARVDYPAHDFVFSNIKNTWNEAGFYLYAGSTGGATNVSVSNYTAEKIGYGYQTTHLFRCGDSCSSNSPAPGDLNNNYWAHVHAIDIRSSGNTVTDSVFSNTAGSEQIFNNNFNQSNNTFERNYFINGAIKAKNLGCGANTCVGIVWSSQSSGGVFRNNVIVNTAGLHITLTAGTDFSNNTFARNPSTSGYRMVFAYYTSGNIWRNNAMCYNRTPDGAAIDNVTTFDGTSVRTVNTNVTPPYGFSTVTGNKFGSCNNSTFSVLSSTSPGPSTGDYTTILTSPTPNASDVRVASGSALESGGVTGGPSTDYLGNSRGGPPYSIGAFEGGGVVSTTTSSSTTTSTTTTTTTTTTIPGTNCNRNEAESATLASGWTVGDPAYNIGYSGSGFIWNTATVTYNGTATFPSRSYTAGFFDVNIRYSNGGASTTGNIKVDGVSNVIATLPNTGSWDNWTVVSVTMFIDTTASHVVSIEQAGNNTLFNLDYVETCTDTTPPVTTTTTTTTSTTTTTAVGATTTTTLPRKIACRKHPRTRLCISKAR